MIFKVVIQSADHTIASYNTYTDICGISLHLSRLTGCFLKGNNAMVAKKAVVLLSHSLFPPTTYLWHFEREQVDDSELP